MDRRLPPQASLASVTAASLALVLAVLSARASAQASAAAPIQGFALDAQVVGGGGFGLGAALDNSFIGRLRAGLLYAFEPWSINLGMTLEIGALADVGIGGELELNQFDGWFGNVGLARIDQADIMGHLSLGFMVFGIEWQHVFAGVEPRDALLFEVRVPIGSWWLTSERKQARELRGAAPPRSLTPTAAGVRPLSRAPTAAPVAQPTAAQPAPASGSPPTAASVPAAPEPAELSEADQIRLAELLDEAASAAAAGDHARQSAALGRAYAIRPDPALLMRQSEALLAQGRMLEALTALRLGRARHSARAELEQQLVQLESRVPKLRLSVSGLRGGERLAIDARPEPSALYGYDIPLDPGEHRLVLLRGDHVLLEQSFSVREAELLRLPLNLP